MRQRVERERDGCDSHQKNMRGAVLCGRLVLCVYASISVHLPWFLIDKCHDRRRSVGVVVGYRGVLGDSCVCGCCGVLGRCPVSCGRG